MKRVLSSITTFVLFGTLLPCSSFGEELQETADFSIEPPKTYTSGQLIDYTRDPDAQGAKGAAILVWSRKNDYSAEVEIYQVAFPNRALRFPAERNFFHTMTYFDKDYEWRVRFTDTNGKPVSQFSEPSPFRIVRKGTPPEEASPGTLSENTEVNELRSLVLDTADDRVRSTRVILEAPAPKPKPLPLADGRTPQNVEEQKPVVDKPLFVEESKGEEGDDADFTY